MLPGQTKKSQSGIFSKAKREEEEEEAEEGRGAQNACLYSDKVQVEKKNQIIKQKKREEAAS